MQLSPALRSLRDAFMGRIEAVVFDLDGTLVDSLSGIEKSLRLAVERVAPSLVIPDLRPFVGPPLPKMLAKIWPSLSVDQITSIGAEFRKHYFDRGCYECSLYPGATEILSALSGEQVKLFVLTNKPMLPTRNILGQFGLLQIFSDVVSPDSAQNPFESKTEAARWLAQTHGLAEPSHVILVGDGQDDRAAAEACGFRFIAAGYGYGSVAQRSEHSVERLSALRNFLF
jgi:phosphoglycolate phosphatase